MGKAVLHIGDAGKQGKIAAAFYPGKPPKDYREERLSDLAGIGFLPEGSSAYANASNANTAFYAYTGSEFDVVAYPFNLRTWVTVTFRNSLLVATLSAKYALLSYFRPSGYDFYCVCDAFFKTEMWFVETPPTSKNEKNRIKRNFSFFAFWAIISLICKTENPVASFSYPSAFPTAFFNPLQILQQEDFSSPS